MELIKTVEVDGKVYSMGLIGKTFVVTDGQSSFFDGKTWIFEAVSDNVSDVVEAALNLEEHLIGGTIYHSFPLYSVDMQKSIDNCDAYLIAGKISQKDRDEYLKTLQRLSGKDPEEIDLILQDNPIPQLYPVFKKSKELKAMITAIKSLA